jgi:hypothetical protein
MFSDPVVSTSRSPQAFSLLFPLTFELSLPRSFRVCVLYLVGTGIPRQFAFGQCLSRVRHTPSVRPPWHSPIPGQVMTPYYMYLKVYYIYDTDYEHKHTAQELVCAIHPTIASELHCYLLLPNDVVPHRFTWTMAPRAQVQRRRRLYNIYYMVSQSYIIMYQKHQ